MITIIKNQTKIAATLGVDHETSTLLHESLCKGLAFVLDLYIIDSQNETTMLEFDPAIILEKTIELVGKPISSSEALLLGYILNDVINDYKGQLEYLSVKHNVEIKERVISTLNMN